MRIKTAYGFTCHTSLTACLKLSRWQKGPGEHSTEQLPSGKMSICSSQSERKFACMPVGGMSERCGLRGWHMKGAALRHTYIHVLFYKKGPVVSQHAAAQGYASRVFPACLRHLSMVSNHLGPTEPPTSGPSWFSVCRQEYITMDICWIISLYFHIGKYYRKKAVLHPSFIQETKYYYIIFRKTVILHSHLFHFCMLNT